VVEGTRVVVVPAFHSARMEEKNKTKPASKHSASRGTIHSLLNKAGKGLTNGSTAPLKEQEKKKNRNK
jgi:hypothetical protein